MLVGVTGTSKAMLRCHGLSCNFSLADRGSRKSACGIDVISVGSVMCSGGNRPCGGTGSVGQQLCITIDETGRGMVLECK